MFTKVCPTCKKQFEAKRTSQKYCSYECQQKWHRVSTGALPSKAVHEKRKCPECGKEFVSRTKAGVFCSRECSAKNNARKYGAKYIAHTINCAICGKTFRANSKARKCCSKECTKTYRNRQSRSDKRITKLNNIDNNIALQTLYERDDGICHICGEQCNFDDSTTVNNKFAAGNSYPSIDHIVPLSKGGKHEWCNVKLAHKICNQIGKTQ